MKNFATLVTPAAAALTFVLTSAALAAPPAKKPAAKPAVKAQNTSKGVNQMQGGDGVFGTVYTLEDGFNFEILSARYSIEPYNAYVAEVPDKDTKLLILTVAIKNANSQDEGFSTEGTTLTAVDDTNQNHDGWNYYQPARGPVDAGWELKPGQGIGQNPADPLLVCIKVPAKAKITKIILNKGRKAVPGEKVVRYFVAGTAGGNAKNVIAPLPAYARDAADPAGAVAADPGTATVGAYVPSGDFAMRLDSVADAPAGTKLGSDDPEDGKKFVVAIVTVKYNTKGETDEYDIFGDGDAPTLVDTDGEQYNHKGGIWKLKASEGVSRKFKPGEEYPLRLFFELPKDSKPKTLILGKDGNHQYAIDLTKLPATAATTP